ncbi:RNA-directed DNA polymerase, eukaryota [Tanacetum coccineum]
MISELGAIDKDMDRGVFDDDTVFRRFELKHKLLNVSEMESKDNFQKSKVKWAVEGDENSKFFHGIINKRRAQLAIRGIFVDGFWETEPGCNSSFVALIPKVMDAKFVNDFRPISLIGSVYKVVTKVLANRLAPVIADLISDTQSAFVAGRQILDGPFILDEILHWCKRKNKKAMFFKVDFAKAYDSASILINGSPSKEYSCHRGLKQGDPLAPYLFILIMESLHLSFNRVVDEGLFKGIQLPETFFLASGLQINILKSQLLGVCVPHQVVEQAASLIGCSIMSNKFRYLGVMVGEYSSRIKAWDDVILKLRSRLSKWKVKTLSIGGRLTLLKSVLGASPIYNMSIFKVPTGVLKVMESIRSRFFNGADQSEKKVTWVAWNKVLASKKHGGLGVSSFFALNRALLLKWVWRFVSQDGSLWEVNKLKGKGFDFWSHCKKRIGNGDDSRFWFDCWIGDVPLRVKFPRLFALDLNKEASVAVKLSAPIDISATVYEIRNYIDDLFLPHQAAQTRWIKYIPIKVNIFAWRARQDCLPTRVNLIRRGITIESSLCPVCSVCEEDVCHIFFRCDLAQLVLRRICRWWGLDPHDWSSFQEWQSWILSIQFSSKFESIGNEGKCALEIEIRLIFHQSIEIDQVGQRFEIVEILTEMVVEVVDSSFLEVILPRSSDMDEVQWVNLDMSMTLVLAIFLGGFLVDDEALEAIIEKI